MQQSRRPAVHFVGPLDNASSFLRLAAARAPWRQLILLVSTGESLEQLAWTVNTISNIRHFGLDNFVILRESARSCAALQRSIRVTGLTRVLADAGGGIACAWVGERRLSELQLEPGWRKRRSLNDLWLLRWWVSAEMLRLRLASVLVLDVDTHLTADPYPALLAEPFLHCTAPLTRTPT